MAIRTVFNTAEDCIRDERQGWLEFVREYGGIARRMLAHYFPTLVPDLDAHLVALVRRAQSGNWFAGLRFANEREFLMALRDSVFAYGREAERVPTPQVSLEQMRQIMKDLTLVERYMLWLFVKGYSAAQIAPMMMNAAATAEAVKKVADERLREVVPGSAPDAFSVSARVLIEQAEMARTEQCFALRTFNNMVNGQISWRERELAEAHMLDCFYCLERFTAFQEIIRLGRDVGPLPETQVEGVLQALNLPPAKRKGMLGKLFSRA